MPSNPRRHPRHDAVCGTGTHARQPAEVNAEREALSKELRRVEAELERLGEAVATGGVAVAVLVRKMKEREERAREVRQQLAARPHHNGAGVAWEAVKQAALARLKDLRELFARNVEGAREVLTSLLRGAIQCRVVEVEARRRFHLSGEAILPGLELVTQQVSPAGVEPALGPTNAAPAPESRTVATSSLPADGGDDGAAHPCGTIPGTNPRATMVTALREAARAALESEDYEAARVAVEALAQLGAGQVVDMLAARRRA